MINYGISTALIARLPREFALQKIAAAGFREIELYGNPDSLEDWPADPAGCSKAIQAAGLTVRSVHTPTSGWKNADPDEAARAAAAAEGLRSLEAAAAVGAKTIVWHANHTLLASSRDYAESFAHSRQALAAFAARSKALKIKVAVENLPGYDKPRLCTTVRENLEMIKGLGRHVGLCLDVGHCRANSQDPAVEARLAGKKLFATHLHDNDGTGGDQHLVPFRDLDGWRALIQALDEIKYRGGRMFEIHPDLGGAALEATLAQLAELARCWR